MSRQIIKKVDPVTDTIDAGQVLAALIAFKKGDFSVRLPVNQVGLAGKLIDSLNDIFELNENMCREMVRVSTAVGKEGKIGQRASLPAAAGGWSSCVEAMNSLISDLVQPSTEVARVIGAVAQGDLSQKMSLEVEGRPLQGEFVRTARVVNTMVGQLNSFASEVTRVAREVGTEGKLGGQAVVTGVAGTWKDLTDSVNSMASNLTAQVRNIAEVTTAVANGDLSRKITVNVQGEILELKNTINTMVDQLGSFASEVTRVAREVGTEGKLGGQADVKGVAGTWKDLTESVNSMAGNLTAQVRNIAEVTTAVARGDLSRKITVDVRGEILELKDTINTMVDQLNSFASEVTRVAREVGTEGKLGGQADVKGVAGTWRDLTESVNSMASNLTAQVRNIADVTTAVAKGDLSRKITVDARGEILALKETINTMVDQLGSFASEVTRVAREVGTEGKLGGQADVKGVAGTWKDLTDSVNSMASNLTSQVRNIAQVTTAVAMGDLSRKITVDVRGEILELKNTINTMVDQLNSFASEVTRVAREVGTDGKLGGQAEVRGVAGTWKDLTDNVNLMAANLTTQVRGIAKVVTAVANGDLERKLILETKGEIAELADTINAMIDTLATFADQVTTVAREVGIEGKLGGQARVPGAAGIWRNLTDNVNQLAANLTTQVRAIAEVATAVTKGDLTQSIRVQAEGEVASLKDNINEMIVNLAETTRKNNDQNWLKTNIAKFTRMVQGQRDLLTVAQLLLSELAPLVSAQRGAFYISDTSNGEPRLKFMAGYGYDERDGIPLSFKFGQGLVGQCAVEKQRIVVYDVPSGYIRIGSSLGSSPPTCIVVLPVLFEREVKAVVELASFQRLSDIHLAFLEQLTESMGIVLNTIAATMRTEQLLQQSQALAEELQKTNAELQEKAQLLADQNTEVEAKNREIEQAKQALEEKAEQLALTSKYKSEFLANMSHELRTPLNNLLILARVLADNTEGNLNPKQVKFAGTIHSSGTDLLALINDILDLSKIESGKMDVEVGNVRFAELQDYCIRTFRHVADGKGLEFSIDIEPQLASEAIRTDAKRLQQVLKNLLSNALKFTQQGSVRLKIERVTAGWSPTHPALSRAQSVIAFSVTDTGIGIAKEKQRIVFEAFQQADGTTSRKYGGTGLGLSISRELARLLGGEIRLRSSLGQGSTFTLFLPQGYISSAHQVETVETARPLQASEIAPDLKMAESRETDPVLAGRKVLIVDDDLRNIFALSMALEQRGLKVLHAENGKSGIEMLRREKDIAVVLLDIMMPEMDGYETSRAIRQMPKFRKLPVIALTAKAMKGDREKCLAAGASDYIAKPVDLDRLFSLMRAWIGGQGMSPTGALPASQPQADSSEPPVPADDRNTIKPGDAVLLIIEDDATFARILVEGAHERGLKALVAPLGSVGLRLAREFRPGAVSLDVRLPDMSGWTVLDLLKHDPATRHIPVHVISGHESNRSGYILGAMSCVPKGRGNEAVEEVFRAIQRSMESRIKKVLIVTDSQALRQEVESFAGAPDIEFLEASSAAEAIDTVTSSPVDGVILDWVLSGRIGSGFIEEMQDRLAPFVPPCIVFGTRKLNPAQAAELHRLSRSSCVRYAPSLERLLDESVLLLHRSEAVLSENQKLILARTREVDPTLAGRKVLVVDDDLRNIFALTSILEQRDLTVLHAEDGFAGIEILQKNPDIDIVIMDVMMPGIDGYETTRRIRSMRNFDSLPVIALTAKAMKGDREKCLAAGASDYVAKPVDLDHLFSVMRVWLARALDRAGVLNAETELGA